MVKYNYYELDNSYSWFNRLSNSRYNSWSVVFIFQFTVSEYLDIQLSELSKPLFIYTVLYIFFMVKATSKCIQVLAFCYEQWCYMLYKFFYI